MNYRYLLTNVLLAGCSTGILIILILIAIYGSVEIIEPSVSVLITEIGLLVIILAFAIYNLIEGIRRF